MSARKAFGQRLKLKRESLELTQMEMAIATGQTYFTFISAVETGKAKLPTKDLPLWASALEVEVPTFARAFLQAYDLSLYEALYGNDVTIVQI